jgi:phosphatidylserine/phosphatidylglycerophosphate/cardiolipin synthase-like enzyme
MIRLPLSAVLGVLVLLGVASSFRIWQPPFPAVPIPGFGFLDSPARAVATERLPGGDGVLHGAWYELAFTQPSRSGRAEGSSPVERILVELIDRSQSTLDVAIHDIDLEPVTDALARAAGRGVRVRVVIESEVIRSQEPVKRAAVAKLRGASIPMVEDRPNGTMHHKFTVADGRWVETGSWNYTFSETYRNNNNAIVIESKELAANYTTEFEKMFVAGQFGGAKQRGVPNQLLTLAGARTENYFSPEDRAAGHVIRWVGATRERLRLHFLAFSFTHDGIGDAVLERFRAGVPVGGVFESADTRTTFSEYGRLKGAGLDVLLDTNPWNLHHKVMVLDGKTTIFGSFNFSASADRDNDENLLIVEDPGLAAAFDAEYERIRAEALRP